MSAWVQTFTGRAFPIESPSPSDIDIDDIAPALSKICRFNGHCRGFYSVAQHSVLVAEHLEWQYAPRHIVRAGLFHDAAEAYVGDLMRPLKELLPSYGDIEYNIASAIAAHYHFPFPLPHEVRAADNVLLATEARDLMAEPPASWNVPEAPASWIAKIEPWSQERAESVFRARARELA